MVNQKKSDSLRFKALKEYYLKNTYSKPEEVIVLTEYHYQLGQEKGSVLSPNTLSIFSFFLTPLIFPIIEFCKE